MYDVDGNGVIDLEEMTKIVQAIYDMLGAGAVKPTDTAEERAKNIFNRFVFLMMLIQPHTFLFLSNWFLSKVGIEVLKLFYEKKFE